MAQASLARHVAQSVIRPGHNAWRCERAGRAAVLIDAGQYFGAVREALLNARSTAFIIGWDLDSRTRLVGEERPGRRRISRRLHRFPHRAREAAAASSSFTFWCGTIRFSTPSSASCFRPRRVRWGTPRQIRFCLDDDLPFGASQHQKIVVVDDAVAFSGGLDLTTRRWDTREHRLDDPRRVDLAGVPYRAVPRRAGDGRRQGRRGAGGARARALGARRLRARAADPPGRRPVAAKHHAGPDRHRRRHRPHRPGARRRERDPRGRSAVLRHGRSRRALHLYREPVSHLETLRRAPCASG